MGGYKPTETLQALAYVAPDRLLQNAGAKMDHGRSAHADSHP
jgi:hypothetical protein